VCGRLSRCLGFERSGAPALGKASLRVKVDRSWRFGHAIGQAVGEPELGQNPRQHAKLNRPSARLQFGVGGPGNTRPLCRLLLGLIATQALAFDAFPKLCKGLAVSKWRKHQIHDLKIMFLYLKFILMNHKL